MSVAVQALPRPRDVLHEFGLYIHIPFCAHRCWYCDFNAYADLDHLADEYMAALVDDVHHAFSAPDLGERPEVTSIFIGGGTPSRVDPRWIQRLLDAARDSWPVAADAEVTIECNPESTDAAKLDTYLRAGVNRISFGVQSLDDALLARLGRVHDASTALHALRIARSAGFENVSADLIYGIPDETDGALRDSLDGVLDAGVDHISCYALIYEDGTPLDSWRRLGKVIPVDDDVVALRWHLTNDVLGEAGFERYEISNWSRPGRESRHNSLYWASGEYLGVGAGAHSHLAPVRSWTVRSPAKYIASVGDPHTPVAGSELIDPRMRATEVMLLGLRRTSGVDAQAFRDLTGRSLDETFGDELRTGIARDLLLFDGSFVRCTQPLLLNEAVLLFA
jgi:putative oxygen-independent coproporphyrinogen III oxidase